MEVAERYHRNTRLFGIEGQKKLAQTKVAIVGVSGLGSPLAQQLALLGVGEIACIDKEELDETNRNRFVGAVESDPIPGSVKVSLACRHIKAINSRVEAHAVSHRLESQEAFEAIRKSDWVFGCLDHDGPRAILNELCVAYDKPYMDFASDVPAEGIYGGRLYLSRQGYGCLHCAGELDSEDVRQYLTPQDAKQRERAIYGVPVEALGEAGPSVAPINGVVASLGAVEFMVAITGMRAPARHLVYHAHVSKVVAVSDQPRQGCVVCSNRGQGAKLDVERYLQIPHLVESR